MTELWMFKKNVAGRDHAWERGRFFWFARQKGVVLFTRLSRLVVTAFTFMGGSEGLRGDVAQVCFL